MTQQLERIDALVMTTTRLKAMVAFYRALGMPLVEERHDDGPLHFACELGPPDASAHVAIYQAKPGDETRAGVRSSLIGFRVASLDVAVRAAVAAGARVEIAPEDVPWGRRAIVVDPDGRRVELNGTRSRGSACDQGIDPGSRA